MPKYIDADALYETLCALWDRADSEEFEQGVFKTIQEAHSADVRENKTAYVKLGTSKDGVRLWYVCSNCGEPINADDNFCCNCGSKLLGEHER